MNELREGYKGYSATVEVNVEEGVLQGRISNIRDVITFQAESIDDLRNAFMEAVDDYLDFCGERGVEPEHPFSGRFLIRLDPGDHRAAAMAADRSGLSLNKWVEAAIRSYLGLDLRTRGILRLPPGGSARKMMTVDFGTAASPVSYAMTGERTIQLPGALIRQVEATSWAEPTFGAVLGSPPPEN